MNGVLLTATQVRYVNKAFWRNPASAFFTFAFPLMFLVIFTSLLGHFKIPLGGGRTINSSTYYVASMATFAVITACFNNIAVALTFQREAGILKRTNGTPLPSAAFLGARIVHALLVSVLLVAITAAFGRAFYSADIPTGFTLLRFLIMLVIGASAFCALGFAITAVIPNADASAVIVNAVILPLLFLSGIWPAGPTWRLLAIEALLERERWLPGWTYSRVLALLHSSATDEAGCGLLQGELAILLGEVREIAAQKFPDWPADIYAYAMTRVSPTSNCSALQRQTRLWAPASNTSPGSWTPRGTASITPLRKWPRTGAARVDHPGQPPIAVSHAEVPRPGQARLLRTQPPTGRGKRLLVPAR